MSFIYVTGAPGIGKSTIQAALTKLGVECYDIDDARLGGPFNLASNKPVIIPPANERADDWFDLHEWRINIPALRGLKHQAKDKSVVICGVAEKDVDILGLFDSIIYLSINNSVLRERLRSRTGNDYGKNEVELQEILSRKKRLDNRYLHADVKIIDAGRAFEEVIKDVVTAINGLD